MLTITSLHANIRISSLFVIGFVLFSNSRVKQLYYIHHDIEYCRPLVILKV